MDSIIAPIAIDLDKRRHLRLDNRALLRAERELCVLWGKKQNLLTVLFQAQDLTLNDLAVLLWVGLLHEDPELSLSDVQDLMDLDKIAAITTAIFEAWNLATAPAPGSARAQEDADGPFPAPSTGAPSGPMGAAALA